jgi:geranylgeranyl pyrophosphate synthase
MSSTSVKKWFVNEEGDITDGDVLIAEPNYLTSVSYKTAHLLAAAPELLAALESITSYCLPNLGDFLMHQSLEDDFRNCVVSARAAIAKAKGE